MFPKVLIGGMLLSIYTCFSSQIKDNPGLLIKPLADFSHPRPGSRAQPRPGTPAWQAGSAQL